MKNITNNLNISSSTKKEVKKNSFFDGKILSEWSQRELTTNFKDIILHFVFSFSSINTRRSYLNDLKEFNLFLENKGIFSIDNIDEKILISWNNELSNNKNLSQKTIRRKLIVISSVFMFCIKRKIVDKNPMDFIQKPKLTFESKTNALNFSEVKVLLTYLENNYIKSVQESQLSRSSKSALLAYSVIATLLSVGMRVDELCQLKIKDIESNSDFTRLHLKVKGNEQHSPIIHPKTAAIIENYRKICRFNSNENDFLFVRSQNVKSQTKLTQPAIYKMLNIAIQSAGIEKKITPHSCRATLATLLHNQGTPIGEIQYLLNHKEISTTAIYIKKANEIEESAALKLNLAKFNPV
ncbi:tyrosine-type recombinase/integrase [Pigmentibacter sp. JX0631]|uniref:tyrosine-type recombinase/integrase n=1 Tax=Pigmentibacter sp. JX0631 TaxID=2976982 RepID=UPI002469820A|nr:tyrosine-type recombinase/integrase [Pigmentibacter sp. JX0631]WGL59095.1 tyrosine-type recombinase/integrase [Pigmentibacter sp. JX0631]